MFRFVLPVLALGLGACSTGPHPTVPGGTPMAGSPPITNAAASAQGVPQSANSLPSGARVNAPLASPSGALRTTTFR